ncbi:uncharacterized protein LOC118423246 [Branchiostoma floridae]|uniref:Uncharacterized protein LOC118423246 n=1 Tax=Branchiostoma floridae TaxID=7739 RepID=C3XUM9_BRAFL|nr:uncharacterized protein LOC118423246 [Branchiostoma floridae]|eukprot:XP_002612219.1 hypothetical protein BRAFLDRAFT_129258 [Branchiostoma floridae]
MAEYNHYHPMYAADIRSLLSGGSDDQLPLDEEMTSWPEWRAYRAHPARIRKPVDPTSIRRVENAIFRKWWQDQPDLVPKDSRGESPESFSSGGSECDAEDEVECTVSGSDMGDVPTEYSVSGIRRHEMPVKGTYVHKTILPGFHYKVRVLNTKRFLFGGRTLRLQEVGRGYGKRITFQGEKLNKNSNYFWSDSHPNGFGFSIVAVNTNDEYTLCSMDGRPIGKVHVGSVPLPQREITSEVVDGKVVKRILVTMTCTVQYEEERHGFRSVLQDEDFVVTGIALVEKEKGSRQANLKTIEDITLPIIGRCFFSN